MKYLKKTALIFLSIFLIGSANAGINECENAYENGYYITAHRECNSEFLQSNGRALFIMASMFEKGQGVNKSSYVACQTFLKAGNLEHGPAFEKIAHCYHVNQIYSQNKVKDLSKWIKKAQIFKQNYLGGSTTTSTIKTKFDKGIEAFDKGDYQIAINYFWLLADNNDVLAQLWLGKVYEKQGEIRSAKDWYKKAEINGNSEAATRLKNLNNQGTDQGTDQVKDGTSPDTVDVTKPLGDFDKGLRGYLKKDYKTALEEWLPFAAENPSHTLVQVYLGVMYHKGYGTPQNYKKALEWFKKAANLRNYVAQYHLGVMHSNGQGVSKSYINGYWWFKKSADRDYDLAQYELAKLYFNGNGVTKDLKIAEEWATKSANQGNNDAKDLLKKIEKRNPSSLPTTKEGQYQKGLQYLNAKKHADAAYWFEKAASRGYPQAQYELAKLYLSGNGVSRSKDIAIIWFKEASKYRDSQYQVGKLYENKREYSSALFWYAKAALAGGKNAKDALIKILKNNPLYLLWLVFPLGILVKLRSNYKKKAKAKKESEAKLFDERIISLKHIAKKEAEAKLKKEAEAKAKKEAEAKAKKEKAERAKKEKAEKAKAKKESGAKAKKESGAKAKKESGAKAKKESEVALFWLDKKAREKKAKKEAEARIEKEAEDKAKREAEAKAKKEAEAKAKKEAEAKAKKEKAEKAKKEKAEKAKKEKAEKAKKEKAEKAKAKKESEAKAKKEKPKKEPRTKSVKPKFKGPSKKRFQIFKLEPGTKDWFEWRHLGIGSSDAEEILWFYQNDELMRYTKADIGHSEELKIHTELLPEARMHYGEKTGIDIYPLCIQDKRFSWLLASIDGISEDFKKLVKISCSDEAYKNATKGLFPDAQLQHQLMITGLEEIDYWSYLPGKKAILNSIKRDQELITKLYEAEQDIAERLL